MAQVDFYIKKLFAFKRLSVDVFVKLEALREEDNSNERKKFLKTTKNQDDPDANFFLDDEDDDNNKQKTIDYAEVRMNNDGEIIDDDTETLEER